MKGKKRKKIKNLAKKPIIKKTPSPNDNLPLPTISLSIIVKDEAPVIERMLNTIYSILDYYIVVDTGSTDGTQEIIKKFFERKGIPGEVIQHPWKNFEDARNKALACVKGKADFGFWIDADEQLIIDPKFNIDSFKRSLINFDGANTSVSYGSQNYFRMQFFSTKKPWTWYGPVHEVLVSKDPTTVGVAEGLKVLVTADGNSWTSESIQQKYEGHAKILEDYVKNDPNKDPRWVFYLAQSYRDAVTPENKKKAMVWYEERSKMTEGYWEEIYYSLLMIASIKGALKYPEDEIINDYLACGKANRLRAEHLIPVILHFQSKKDFERSYVYSSHAMKVAGKSPFPQASLFIDPSIYDWRIFDIHSLNCYYTNRKPEAIKSYRNLQAAIKKGVVPVSEIERIKNNEKWFR